MTPEEREELLKELSQKTSLVQAGIKDLHAVMIELHSADKDWEQGLLMLMTLYRVFDDLKAEILSCRSQTLISNLISSCLPR